MKCLFTFSAICPGHVEPLPRLSRRNKREMTLPITIRKIFTTLIIATSFRLRLRLHSTEDFDAFFDWGMGIKKGGKPGFRFFPFKRIGNK